MTRLSIFSIALLTLAAACGVEPLEDTGEDDGIPTAVQEAFTNTCATQAGCHATTTTPPLLTPGSSATILSLNKDGKPYVDFGNVDNSYLADRLLAANGTTVMPLGGAMTLEQEEDVALILGWIAGAMFSDIGADSEGMTATSTSTTSSTTSTSTSTSGGTTSSGTTETGGETDETTAATGAYAPLQALWLNRCTNGSCHFVFSPIMSEGVSYDNLVNATGPSTNILIAPGDLDGSYVWQRLNGIPSPMPPATEPQLTAEELSTIEDWILAGAPR